MVENPPLSWSKIIDRENEKVEFGSCHENYAWRPHDNLNHKFDNLQSAFNSNKNSIRLLLQHPRGNQNARNYQERGRAIYVAVWYENSDWAILCNASHATLVSSNPLKSLSRCKINNPEIVSMLSDMYDSSPSELWRHLNDQFYHSNIECNL